ASKDTAKKDTAQAKHYVWKLQCAYPKGDQTYDVQMPMIVKTIEKATNNQITFQCFNPGALCEPEQAPASCASGLMECCISAPNDCGQVVPAAYAEQGIPFYWENGQDVYDTFYDYGMLQFLRKEYAKAGLYYGMFVPNGAYSLMTKFPVNSTTDLKGKKIRASSSYGEFVNQMGASPVTMPGGDLYMGLKLGTIDGCIYTVGELGNAKLMEVVSNVMVQPGSGSAPVNFIIGQKAWNALPKDLQDKVNKAMQEEFMPIYKASVAVDDKAIAEAKAYGVKFTEVSPENMKAFWEAGSKTADYVISQYPAAKPGIEIIKKWHTEKKAK
ncbi:MAG TPA: TRAP transporter substrate-binding protein DctP, partial [Syntrophomonadaceae bacterium]|nr:TRAP transporter substrate-binding protein DctP [Syntrophomonadaceae bacterium]